MYIYIERKRGWNIYIVGIRGLRNIIYYDEQGNQRNWEIIIGNCIILYTWNVEEYKRKTSVE